MILVNQANMKYASFHSGSGVAVASMAEDERRIVGKRSNVVSPRYI